MRIAVAFLVIATLGCSYTPPRKVAPLVSTANWFEDVATLDVEAELANGNAFVGVLWRPGCGGCLIRTAGEVTNIAPPRVLALTQAEIDGDFSSGYLPKLDTMAPPDPIDDAGYVMGGLVVYRDTPVKEIERDQDLNIAFPFALLEESEAARMGIIAMLPVFIGWLAEDVEVADFRLDEANIDDNGVVNTSVKESEPGAHAAIHDSAAVKLLLSWKLCEATATNAREECGDPPLETVISRFTDPLTFAPGSEDDLLTALKDVDVTPIVDAQ